MPSAANGWRSSWPPPTAGADRAVHAIVPRLLDFGRLLRERGLDVHMGRMLDVIEALPLVDVSSRDQVFHACRTLLVHRREDLPAFATAFDDFWRTQTSGRQPAQQGGGPAVLDLRETAFAGMDVTTEGSGEPSTDSQQVWSSLGTLATKDFSEFTSEEVALARTALESLTWTPGERRTRRWVRGPGSRIDLRRALA